jgi:hypothetical protein
MSPWDRCITRGIPGGFFPAGYNNAYQIVQSKRYVVIHYEMIHAARVIPTDGRAHAPANMRTWDGDSVGHWEGDTLVVDITNYNGKGWIATNARLVASKVFSELNLRRRRFADRAGTSISRDD